jgi:hypothetical protein
MLGRKDFKSCTWGDQPTLAAAKGGPECGFLLNVIELNQQSAQIADSWI